MQLTVFTDYGLRTLMYVALHREKLSNVKEIAEQFGVSRNHLVKVVHRLSQLEYINTKKGKGGGIQMVPGTENLRLGDIISSLEPNMNVVECFDPNTNTCRITNSCQLKHYVSEATQSFIDTMNNYTLADTLSNNVSLFK